MKINQRKTRPKRSRRGNVEILQTHIIQVKVSNDLKYFFDLLQYS